MARYERLPNDAKTTLNGGINGSVTSIVVTDGSVFPATGDYRVRIDSEVVLVTARSTNTLTVVRGADGTAATTHTTGSVVRTLATVGQWDKVLDDVYAGASACPPHRILDSAGDQLVAADFSWVNQGTATLSDTAYDGLTMFIPADAGTDMRLAYTSLPSDPWVFYGHAQLGYGYASASDFGGFFIREASSANFYIARMTPNSNLIVQRFTSPTSGASTLYNQNMTENRMWFKIEDNSTNLIFSISWDGIGWHPILTQSRTTYFTTAADQVGVFGNGGGGSDWYMHFTAFMIE